MNINLSEWQKLSPLSILLFIVKVIRVNWAVIPALYFSFDNDISNTMLLLILIGVSLLTIISAFLWYKNFSYRLIDSELQIKTGVFAKKLQLIAYDRIQSINTTQNIIFRLFKVVKVTMDTAGSSSTEVELKGIPFSSLAEIKNTIHSEKITESDDVQPETKLTENLLSYTFFDLFKIGMSSNRFLIALAGLWATSNIYDEKLLELSEQFFDLNISNTVDQIDMYSFSTYVFLIGLCLVGFVLFSFLGALISFYEFRLSIKDNVIRKKSGLFSKKEDVLSISKIQSLRIIQNIRQRWFNQFNLVLKQASSTEVEIDKGTFAIPLTTEPFNSFFLNEVFETISDTDFLKIDKYYITRYLRLVFIIPALLMTTGFYFIIGNYAFLCLGWIALGFFLLSKSYSKWGYLISDSILKIRSGVFGEEIIFIEPYKIQSVKMKQSPFQRRRNLASLQISTASETLTIPFLQEEAVSDLMDQLTFIIESTSKKWF